jgi:hypothetical protein
MAEPAAPPLLLEDVIEDPQQVVALLERNAPYTPLGGWYRPGQDLDAATNPLWFQNDWVHAGMTLPGAELFRDHPRYLEAARSYAGAEEIVPQSVYVNVMAALGACGPAHTDNPKFRGRERANTPMWLLRTMLFSGLFRRWEIIQTTAIWWMDDVEGGGLAYWADGPDAPPRRHVGAMANTALVGDNHHMFHQVEPVGPFEERPRLVTPRAELGPAADGSGDWVVRDRGGEAYRAPLSRYRVSVLWKADVYPTAEERRRVEADVLSLDEVCEILGRDLEARGRALSIDVATLDDPALQQAVQAAYPEPRPVGVRPSIFG